MAAYYAANAERMAGLSDTESEIIKKHSAKKAEKAE